MAAKKDYYQVLGVSRQADNKAIKEAFRNLALRYHPDRNKEPGAEQKFKEIAEAYAVLTDPDKKRQYDQQGFAGVADLNQEDLFSGINFDEIFRDFGTGFGPSFFDNFFGGRRSARSRGDDLEMHIELSLQKIMTGGAEYIDLDRKQICAECSGTGAARGTTPQPCERCKGRGQIVTSRTDAGIRFQKIETCLQCHGKGTTTAKPCRTCGGSGKVSLRQRIEIQIPKGIEDGTSLRVARQGQKPASPQGTPGDLFLIVHTAPDQRFKRSGADLWYAVHLSLYDAVLGTQLPIPTLTGEIVVKIPPGTQPQTSLRIKDKGLPRFQKPGLGDLYLAINVQIPEKLTSQEKHLFEQLRQLQRKRSVPFA